MLNRAVRPIRRKCFTCLSRHVNRAQLLQRELLTAGLPFLPGLTAPSCCARFIKERILPTVLIADDDAARTERNSPSI